LALVPTKPHDPEAWPDRMSIVITILSDRTKKRDDVDHRPSGNAVTASGNSVVLHPIFRESTWTTEELITLTEVPVVYGASAATDDDDAATDDDAPDSGAPGGGDSDSDASEGGAPQGGVPVQTSSSAATVTTTGSATALTVGQECVLNRKVASVDFFDVVGGTDAKNCGIVKPNTKVRIELVPATSLEVPATSQKVWVSAPKEPSWSVSDVVDARAYFQVPRDALS